ncbi:hypothetical protein M9Y10_038698 [Tritrichomonas musculus]|uniref:Uncharacterized protein n=1 Tax=Tritrichomonas musculus TaxID=1915356 RepID=A0ABR2KCA6_9EUKA
MSTTNRFDPTKPILLTGEYESPLGQEKNDQIQDIPNDSSVNPLISFFTNSSIQNNEENDAPQTTPLPVLW